MSNEGRSQNRRQEFGTLVEEGCVECGGWLRVGMDLQGENGFGLEQVLIIVNIHLNYNREITFLCQSFSDKQGHRCAVIFQYMELSNEQLAQQLHKLKIEQSHKQAMIDSILTTDPQIKDIKNKINASYTTKERARQIAEQQMRNLQQKQFEARQEADMLANSHQLQAQKQAQEQALIEMQRNNMKILQAQMDNRRELQEEARKEYLKERAVVNREVQELRKKEYEKGAIQQQKKKILYEAMLEQHELKEQMRMQSEEADRKELSKLANYQSKLDQRSEAHKLELAKKEKERDAIYLKLKAQEQERKKELEDLEQMRMEYYQFIKEEEVQKREEEELRKKEQFKNMLKKAAEEQQSLKAKQKQQENYLEVQFRAKMLERLAQLEKLDQLAREKKRMRELEHKREVQKLWQIKLQQYREQQEKEQRQIEEKRLIDLWRIAIVQKEKDRIIQENAQNLAGFLHPELIQRARKVADYRPGTAQNPSYLKPYQP